MKQLCFSLAVIALAQFSTSAQPVANASDVAVSSFSGEFYFGQADGLDPGTAGPNKVWDYSNLQLTLAGQNNTVPVAGSPYANQFPDANWCYTFSAFGMTKYYYHLVTPTKLDMLTLAIDGNFGENYSQNPRTIAEFPMTYNSSYTDTYRSVNDPSDTQVTATYDAYGTLILPTGTYHNVIRQKVVTNGVTDYVWFNVSPFYYLLQTVFEENSIGVLKQITLGTNDRDKLKMFAAYPNPVSNILTVEGPETLSSPVEVRITDLTGKVLSTTTVESGSKSLQINTAAYPAGVYILKITDKTTNASTIRKIVKQ